MEYFKVSHGMCLEGLKDAMKNLSPYTGLRAEK
jgi:hypothetical protein